MAEQSKRKPYQTDLSNEEWQKVEHCIPEPKTKRGRKREHSYREILNGGRLFTTTSASGALMEHGNALMPV